MKKILLIIFISGIFAQTDSESLSLFPSSDSVLDSLANNYNQIEDYYVQIELSIQTPMLRMPRKKVEFWYKKPNLTKAEAKGFAAIPKSGLVSSPVDLFDNLDDIKVVGAEYLNDAQVWILRGTLHPDSLAFKNIDKYNNSLELSMRLYVDREKWILVRSETWMDTTRVLEIDSEYINVKDDIYLPKETIVKFEYSKDLTAELDNSLQSNNQVMNMKKDMMLDSETGDNLKDTKFDGLITLKFSKYKVNQGLEEDFFIEETKE
jgi:outer membrane lipoprotein-sorting protein